MIYLLEYGLGLATVGFIVAYVLARRHIQPAHQYVAAASSTLTVIIGLALIIMVQIVSGGDRAAVGIKTVSWASEGIVLAHRITASVAFVMMLALSYLGVRRKLQYHRSLAPYFLLLYILVYISGVLLFEAL